MTTYEKILDLAKKVKNPPNWWWKVLGGLCLTATTLWLYWLLSHKAKELTTARAQLAVLTLKAMQAETAATIEKDTDKRKAAETKAAELFAKVAADETTLANIEAAHLTSIMQINAIQDKDWASLNKLAGVPSETTTPC